MIHLIALTGLPVFHPVETIDIVQEWTDVLQTALSFSWSHINWKLSAAEVVPERGRWV